MENPIKKMDDLGVPLFLETPIYQIICQIWISYKKSTKSPRLPCARHSWQSCCRKRRRSSLEVFRRGERWRRPWPRAVPGRIWAMETWGPDLGFWLNPWIAPLDFIWIFFGNFWKWASLFKRKERIVWFFGVFFGRSILAKQRIWYELWDFRDIVFDF